MLFILDDTGNFIQVQARNFALTRIECKQGKDSQEEKGVLSSMTSQEQAQALVTLDRLYDQKDSFRSWLAGDQASQADYDAAVARLETANPGLVIRYVDLGYRTGHVLAPYE